MNAGPTTYFETGRLVARSFVPADAEAFAAYRGDPDVARYQSWSDFTLDDARAFVRSLQGEQPGIPGNWFQIALESRADGVLVGDLAFHIDEDEQRQAEIGFTLAPAQQGRGFGTEAATALLDWAFPTFGLHRVIAIVDVANTASSALLERLGFRREAHLVENVFFKGSWGSEYQYAVLEREWSARTMSGATSVDAR
jgi:RimJ/RimL family protein N-acetyltransferase